MPEEPSAQESTRLPPLSQCLWRETTKHDMAKPVLQGQPELSPLLRQLKALPQTLSENT